jgi:hypothetical protein
MDVHDREDFGIRPSHAKEDITATDAARSPNVLINLVPKDKLMIAVSHICACQKSVGLVKRPVKVFSSMDSRFMFVRERRQQIPNLTLAQSLKYLGTAIAPRRTVKLEAAETKLTEMKIRLKKIMESPLLTPLLPIHLNRHVPTSSPKRPLHREVEPFRDPPIQARHLPNVRRSDDHHVQRGFAFVRLHFSLHFVLHQSNQFKSLVELKFLARGVSQIANRLLKSNLNSLVH